MVNSKAPLRERSASRRLVALTQSAVDAIISADSDGCITDWNPAAERLFGHRKADIVGKHIESLIPERFRARHRAGMARAAQGKPGTRLGTTAELSALRKDGTEFSIELSLSAFKVDGKRFFTGVIRDISSRKAIEARLGDYAVQLEERNVMLTRQHKQLLSSQRELRKVLDDLEDAHRLLADFMSGHILAGRYRLEHKVGSNDVAARYQAIDLEHDAPVYVGLLRCARTSPTLVQSTIHAQLADLPNTPEIFDVGVADVGLPFLVTEPLSGESLADRLARRRDYDTSEALRWCSAVAVSLDAAHRRHRAHGRLSDAAIFFQDADTARERLLVLEYEVGPVAAVSPCSTLATTVTDPRYRAPELCRVPDPTAATDCYALCALVAGLSLRTARAPSEMETSELRAALPAGVADIVVAGLDRDPLARPSSAELRDSLVRTADALATRPL